MVFESLVADILNRFLGDYVENLNRDQLKIGIWGGDVVLENLILKQTALDDLDLPLRVSYGSLGKLVLKIPWKNLYGAPVEVEIQNLLIIAIPNDQIVYNAEREEKYKQDAKQAELQRIEEAKLKELAKDKPPANDTFVEKITTQIIKNVQIKITNIHIRYEDRIREIPFAMGCTLRDLTIISTDSNWKPNVGAEVVAEIFKILKLDSLAVYWNPLSEFYSDLAPGTIVQRLSEDVISKSNIPKNYDYILGPINADSRLKLHPKPENYVPQFSIPKVLLNLGMEKLVIAINKPQFQGIMLFVDSMQWMKRAADYRKYRPDLKSYRGHYKEWWKFAYTCILETVVRRRRLNWDINHIMAHRKLCKEYAESFKEKISNKKAHVHVIERVSDCEKQLDVFNIVIIRQRVQLEVQRLDELAKQEQAKKGWFGYFWSSTPNQELNSQTDLLQQFEAVMTSDEKAKLYQAIGYTEESGVIDFPKDYVGQVFAFTLQGLEAQFLDENAKCVMNASILGVDCRIEQRPRTGGLKVDLQMTQFLVNGMEQNNFIPKMVHTTQMEDLSIIDFMYETLPLDELCHQRIRMSTRPCEIVYDAQTVIELVKIFETPKSVNVDQLAEVVNDKMADFKEMSRTGMLYSLEQHMKVEIDLDFGSMYIVMPHGGIYTGKESVLVADLGNVKVRTVRADKKPALERSDSNKLERADSKKRDHSPTVKDLKDVEEIKDLTYEKYVIKLKHLQVVAALAGENWLNALEDGNTKSTDLHVVTPTNLQINVSRCLITDDPRLPKVIVNAVLPNVKINLTDSRVLAMISLATSIKLPSDEAAAAGTLRSSTSVGSSRSTLYLMEQSIISKYVQKATEENKVADTALVQLTNLVVNFKMHEFQIQISKDEDIGLKDIKAQLTEEAGSSSETEWRRTLMCSFSINDLEFDMTGQTYNQLISVKLGGVSFKQYLNNEVIPVIKTLRDEGGNEYLVTANYISVNKKSPEFVSKYESCEQSVFFEFRKLLLLLHLEALTNLLTFVNNVQLEVNKIMYVAPDGENQFKTLAQTRVLDTIAEDVILTSTYLAAPTPRKNKSSRSMMSEVVLFKIDALLHEFSLTLATSKRELCTISVRGLYVDVILKKSSIQIVSMLRQLYVYDPNPQSIYHDILTSTEDETLRVSIIYYIKEELSPLDTDLDLSINVRMNAVRIVFLNWFVSTQLDFLNNFQDAQEAIAEASAAAAESAKQNVQSAYEHSIRIKLNINLKAPDILIPVHSKSLDAILIDLGHLKLANSIMAMTNYDEALIAESGGICPVVEEMHIVLENMKLSRVRLNSDYSVDVECVMLEPISITLEIQRNLTPAQYRQIPDIDVTGRLQKIELNMSHVDYGMIMLALTKNFSETDPDKTVEKAKSVTTVQSARRPDKTARKLSTQVSENAIMPDEKVNVFLKFAFTMDTFVINLFSASGDLLPSVANKMTHREIGLGKFHMDVLSVKGRILSDQTIITSVVLVECVLDDMRPKRSTNAITRLLKRRVHHTKSSQSSTEKKSAPGTPTQAAETPSKSMVDVTFQQKGNDMFVDVRIFSLDVIVATEYLTTLTNFFAASFAEEDEEAKTLIPVTKSSTTFSQQKLKKPSSLEVTPPPPVGSMTINLRMEQPDIVLVETTDKRDIDAVICNCEVILKARMSGEHQVINGSVNNLQIFTCKFQRKRRKDTMYSILHPLSISIAGSTPAGDPKQGLHLDVIVTDVRIRVSPATIELLNRILAAFSAQTNQADKLPGIGDFAHETLWDPVEFRESDFWYLKAEEGLEINEEWFVTKQAAPAAKLNEMCLLSMPSIVFTIEAGISNQTLPMILLESKVQAVVGNWSSQMYVDASLTLQMAYYNSKLAVWEPLIEPNEYYNDGVRVSAPWELKFELLMKEQEDVLSPLSTSSVDVDDPSANVASQCILISSKENLEITVTKECLNVVDSLSKAFSNAIQTPVVVETVDDDGDAESHEPSPFRVVNDTGLSITLMLYSTPFMVAHNETDYNEVLIEEGGEVALDFRNKEDAAANNAIIDYHRLNGPTKDTSMGTQFDAMSQTIHIKVQGSRNAIELPIIRADKRYFPVILEEMNAKWGIISDIKVVNGTTVITIRSVVEIQNHFDQEIHIYYLMETGKEVEMIKVVGPNAKCNLPLHVVHTGTSELFFGVPGYSITTTPFAWKNLQLNLAMAELLECRPKDKKHSKNGFFIQVTGELEQIYNETTAKFTMTSVGYTLHLYPAISFRNCLPYPIVMCISGSTDEVPIEPGHLLHLPTVQPNHTNVVIRVDDYLEKTWSCTHLIEQKPDEFSVWSLNSYDSISQMTLDLGVMAQFKQGCITFSIYCPFWMINKTGLMLTYRANSEDSLNVLYHPENFKGPIMFAFNSKNFFGKKKASIRVESGEWSNKFSLDVAGSSGVVACKCNDQLYQIGVQNQLTYNGLSKQIVFTPLFVVINNSPFDIEVQEIDRPGDPWLTVPNQDCVPLWPRSTKDDKMLRIRIVGYTEISAPFLITEVHSTLLKLTNKFGGVHVEVHMQEGSNYINLSCYRPGLCPGLIINQTDYSIKYWEKESINIRTLDSYTCVLYTWENPAGKRTLVWDSGRKSEIENDLRRDGLGEIFIPNEETGKFITIYWVSFLDGLQRVLLFTDQKTVAGNAQTAGELEPITQEINVSIHGIGLSLVNNVIRKEIMYIGIASSGIIWETAKHSSDRFKPLTMIECQLIETAYQNYLQQIAVHAPQPETSTVVIDQKYEVDFFSEMMIRPSRRRLRRSFQTGLWTQIKTSANQLQLHAKINRLQIDNQLYDCIFPVVLAPVPPPKSVAANSALKPFVELSIVQRVMKHSSVQQYKYFSVLIQEFHVKLDLGFINAIIQCVEPKEATEPEILDYFKKDLSLVDEPLQSHVSIQSQNDATNFYDLLHFSPLKIHVSFSLQAGSQDGAENRQAPEYLGVLLQGIGVTLTDLHDVVFRLAYFERNYVFLSQKQLIQEASLHYMGQLVKQLYVLVLGLDVIGNPYGLVLGITKGVEDLFYEPFQGAIQGPGEFAEGLALGVRSLFGHTIGGAAGAVSRITGAMGKGIAALSFDDEYQRRRRDLMNKRPANIQEGIARGGKGLVMGVFDGVTGVFVKPVSGAKEQGVEGFFKGLGKGAIGLVARPAAGVVDFASGTLDSVKRAAEGEDVGRLRPPRFLQSDGLVLPYCRLEAAGHKLLMELEKGKYSKTDIYVTHLWVVQRKEILLLTDKRVAYIVHNDLFGGWQVDWQYTWSEMLSAPKANERGIFISLPEPRKKKMLGFFSSNEMGKLITIPESRSRQELFRKMQHLFDATKRESR